MTTEKTEEEKEEKKTMLLQIRVPTNVRVLCEWPHTGEKKIAI